VLPHMSGALGLARILLQDNAAAEDAVQEATTKAWRSYESLRDPALVQSWYFAIVVNVCRSMRRRRWWQVLRMPLVESQLPDRDESQVDEVLQLRVAFRRLQSSDRALLAMHYALDMPVSDVARTLHITESAAKSRLHDALGRLRSAYREGESDE